ncbi:MAG: hypothetical protein IE909_18320, partial [Campylobacterales bacterium]|nr:hypothetical protein [Campylobacterales bacterium]
MKNLSIKAKVIVFTMIGLLGIIFGIAMSVNDIKSGENSLDNFVSQGLVPSQKATKLYEDISWFYYNVVEVTGEFVPTVSSHDQIPNRIKAVEDDFKTLTEDVFIKNQKTIDN